MGLWSRVRLEQGEQHVVDGGGVVVVVLASEQGLVSEQDEEQLGDRCRDVTGDLAALPGRPSKRTWTRSRSA